MVMKSRRQWWTNAGQGRCGVCAQRYAAEVEHRCAACDTPVCPHCVVIVRKPRATYCPSCPTEPGGD